VLCPIDPQGGGTWLGVNNHSLVLALVNDYQGKAVTNSKVLRSRGLLMLDLLNLRSLDEVQEAFHKIDKSSYAGFYCHAFDLKGIGTQIHWDGTSIRFRPLDEIVLPVSSSSIYPEAAKEYRIRNFSSDYSIDEIRNFHATYDEQHPGLSPWMVRSDAKTQSYTEINLTEHRATMKYGKTVKEALNRNSFELKLDDRR
jgi:hypothetical protein